MQFKMAMDLQKNEFFVKSDSQCLTALMKVINNNSSDGVNKDKNIQSAIDIINGLIE